MKSQKATGKTKAGKQKTTFQESKKATSKKWENLEEPKKPDQVNFFSKSKQFNHNLFARIFETRSSQVADQK